MLWRGNFFLAVEDSRYWNIKTGENNKIKLITKDTSGPCLGLLGQRRWHQISLAKSGAWQLGRKLVVGDDRQMKSVSSMQDLVRG